MRACAGWMLHLPTTCQPLPLNIMQLTARFYVEKEVHFKRATNASAINCTHPPACTQLKSVRTLRRHNQSSGSVCTQPRHSRRRRNVARSYIVGGAGGQRSFNWLVGLGLGARWSYVLRSPLHACMHVR